MAVIINANREGYGLDQIGRTMTVGDLMEVLSQFDEDTPVYIGNDRQSYGWYTYGGVTEEDIEEKDEEEEDEEE